MDSLRDRAAQARIRVRIDRLSVGNFGDVRPWVKVSPSYGSTTDLDTGSTSSDAATR
jgi:hypothetical protein